MQATLICCSLFEVNFQSTWQPIILDLWSANATIGAHETMRHPGLSTGRIRLHDALLDSRPYILGIESLVIVDHILVP